MRFGPVLLESRPVLDEIADGVEPEAIHPAREPAPGDGIHLGADRRIAPVQVWHPAPEHGVVVPGAGAAGLVPRRPGAPGLRPARVRRAPDVPVAVRRREPRVLNRGVIGDEVQDDLDAAPVALRDQRVHRRRRAVIRVDAVVVGDVVAVVARRRVDRHEPDGVDPEVGRGRGVSVVQVVELLDQPRQVAFAVAVRVAEAADEDFVDDGAVPPLRGKRRLARRRHERRSGSAAAASGNRHEPDAKEKTHGV